METHCEQTVRLNLLHYPVSVLGPGKRVGIWFQGCGLACNGCMSKHTWDSDEGKVTNVSSLVQETISYNVPVTISGGEPFEQPEALYTLVKQLKYQQIEVLVYTGFPFSYITEKYSYILKYIDVMIDGDYQKDLPTELMYKGSDNQNLILFTNNDMMIEKYTSWANKTDKNLQIVQHDNDVYILGIPAIKDTRRLVNGSI